MATVLMGYENKAGQFTNRETGELIAYDNYVLHFTSDDREEVKGWFCGSIKCKSGTFRIIGADTIDECLGKEVLMVMDMTASTPTVGSIVLVSPSEAAAQGLNMKNLRKEE